MLSELQKREWALRIKELAELEATREAIEFCGTEEEIKELNRKCDRHNQWIIYFDNEENPRVSSAENNYAPFKAWQTLRRNTIERNLPYYPE